MSFRQFQGISGLTDCLKLIAIKQNGKFNKTKHTTIPTMAELVFAFLHSASERNAVFNSISNISTLLECSFREQEHLKHENRDEMRSTCCLQIISV